MHCVSVCLIRQAKRRRLLASLSKEVVLSLFFSVATKTGLHSAREVYEITRILEMTPRLSRRNLLASSLAAASAAVLKPVSNLAAAVKPIRIIDVQLFDIDIPVSKAEHDA